ncbi:hypothetical protein Vadar_014629 [Vaccinium darrowii]|uniref:Uncharacterized protein n=1 Tax=Vaccinium darrowii TaxID=229202 RepID=A0ACB7XIP8_9ERIC|nr:hypothetical protein Vadar_014629 [Vaccinium darrowii]
MATSSSQAKVSLKLLIDSKAKRVLFAEAGKDFVDFLFSLLHLPVGAVVRLLTEQTMVGTLGNLYESIQNLRETYFLSAQTKDYVLKPKAPFSATQVPLLSLDGGMSVAKKIYTCFGNGLSPSPYNHKTGCYCPEYHAYVTDNARAICPSCNKHMSGEVQFVAGPATEVGAAGDEGGFVKGVVTYMVMDDLVVTPMSTISSITLLNKFNVQDVGALEERTVDLGMPEGLKLLKASLHTKTVLINKCLPWKHSGIKMDGYFYRS